MSLKAKVEAIIYAAEEPITLEQIAQLVREPVLAEIAAEKEQAARDAADKLAEDATTKISEDAGDEPIFAQEGAEGVQIPQEQEEEREQISEEAEASKDADEQPEGESGGEAGSVLSQVSSAALREPGAPELDQDQEQEQGQEQEQEQEQLPHSSNDGLNGAPSEPSEDSISTENSTETEDSGPSEELGQAETAVLAEQAAETEVVKAEEVKTEESGEARAEEAGAKASAEVKGPEGTQKKRAPKKSDEEIAQDKAVRGRVREIVIELIGDYASETRGMEIRQVAGGFRMSTKPEHHDVVRAFAKSQKPPIKLSLAALETLAVIAYKQPITGPEISEIRGVESAGVLGTLLDRKLITTAGRKQVIGRPMQYKTSKEFLLRFGLNDVNELPSMEEFTLLAAEATIEVAPEKEKQEGPSLFEGQGEEQEQKQEAVSVEDGLGTEGVLSQVSSAALREPGAPELGEDQDQEQGQEQDQEQEQEQLPHSSNDGLSGAPSTPSTPSEPSESSADTGEDTAESETENEQAGR